MSQILFHSSPTVNPVPPDPPGPIDEAKLKVWPRYGMSIAGIIVGSDHDIDGTVNKFIDAGVKLTRINLLSALWNGVDILPYRQTADGRWDLYDWNPAFFERVEYIRDKFNSAGIVVIWTNYELYSWSDRKKGPQQNNTPYRHNVNGVYWDPTDVTFGILPDAWSLAWISKIVPYLKLDYNVFEIGNEFPEKALHERVADHVRSIQSNALISINRNEDTPGQYENMKIGKGRYDKIAHHGRYLKEVRDLDRNYPREPKYNSFNEFFKRCPHDPKRIMFSSDGARTGDSPIDTYDWGKLRDFFQEVMKRGCSIEHQSRAKMTPAPNHHMIEVEWFRSVIGK